MLASAEHRPWPPPSRAWVMAQRWHDLLFAHWPLPASELREAVPESLEVDTFDGQAWLGVIPFRMSGVRLRFTPALPGLSAFPELNVRTYVVRGDRPGVYFFSLDAAQRLAVGVARRWYHLPYFLAEMTCAENGGWVEYRSRRQEQPPGEFHGRYRPTGDVFRAQRSTLEYFLTERYCLYTLDPRGRLFRGEIHHAPWPLQPAEAEIETNTMAAAAGFRLPDANPVLYFARRLDVCIWPLQAV